MSPPRTAHLDIPSCLRSVGWVIHQSWPEKQRSPTRGGEIHTARFHGTPINTRPLYVLFFIDLTTRQVYLGGITTNPDTQWMMQIAKNVTDPFDGFFLGKRYLIIDRDGKYCDAFVQLLEDAGVKMVLLPPKSPNLNAHAERFVRTIKSECTDRLIFFGDRSVYRAVVQFLEYYNRERFHQGMDNELLTRVDSAGSVDGELVCRERLGGMLKYYSRRAA